MENEQGRRQSSGCISEQVSTKNPTKEQKQDQNSDCNIAVTWVTEGKRRKGRPKITWRRLVEKERKEQDGNRGRN